MSKSDLARYRRLAKEGSWIVVGQIVSVFGSLVLVRVLTERLDPVQYGQLALGLTVAGLVNQVAMGGVGNGIGRFYSIAAEKQDLSGYWLASRRLMVYATLAVLVIGLILMSGLLFLGHSQWMELASVTLVFSVLGGYNSVLSGIQNAARQRAVVAFHGGLDAWLKILLAVGMLLWLGNSGTAVVMGYALSSLLVTGSQFVFLRRLISNESKPNSDSRQWVLRMWAYAWPFSTWGIFTWVQQSSERWALEAFATTRDVGLYAVLFQLGYTPIAMATGLAMSFLGPILYQRSGDATDHARNTNVHRLAWHITFFCMALTLIAFMLALGLHDWIFGLLVAIEYRTVSYLLPWMVLAGGIFAAGQMLALKMMSELKSVAMVWAKISTATLGVLFNIYGASLAGVKGIIVATVSFSAIYFIWMFVLSFQPSADSSHKYTTEGVGEDIVRGSVV
jgi:O-antigen/teichoic acid export membrane protein